MLLYIPDFPQCFGKDRWPKQMWKGDSRIWTMSVSWIFKIRSAVWQKYCLLLRLLLAWLLHPTVTFLPVFPSMVPAFTWLVSMEGVNHTAGVALVLVLWLLLSPAHCAPVSSLGKCHSVSSSGLSCLWLLYLQVPGDAAAQQTHPRSSLAKTV